MSLTRADKALLAAYGLAWRAAAPLLRLSPRLRKGLDARHAPQGWSPRAGLWLHAASVGEAYLAWEIIRELPALPDNEPLLCTTATDQGMDILAKARDWARQNRPEHKVQLAYLPLDAPSTMGRALDQARPRAVALLETELWPGLLAACARRSVPVLVVNGRMRTRSLSHYLALSGFLRRAAPARVLAVSEPDARRFATLFGADRARVMPNIKFDRLRRADAPGQANPLAQVVGQAPLLVLGSVRGPEEPDVQRALAALRTARPRTTTALFPRHQHRLQAWAAWLTANNMPWVFRSHLASPAAPGAVILWDAFGELGHAYGLARAAFVGGSLKPLGGQNFLEPLAHGLVPVMGPHWDNFAWVGSEIADQGLVRTVQSPDGLADALVQALARPAPKDKVKERFDAYVKKRQGGTALACKAITEIVRGETL